VFFLAAAAFFFPRATGAGPAWEPYPVSARDPAAAGRAAIIEFGAAWCVPCRELDEKTFSDARVRDALSQRRLYKADLTRTGSTEVAELSDRFAILGVPTIVFLDATGKERTDLRLVGFEGPDAFLARLAKAP
jgi:thiol:disulfide interchange protein DsbD